ncbi:efflux transporter outer membrane subunit [Sphingobacterium spiritivorum]|uniref:Efflux transporter, outer membrane factor lipoprotein, NodT family n=1 Tax=Sphingobacterium spiritivorum ATCC 33861 TaxID=525373 RepID=D7VTM9_SPHSI|nr:efflux transporter outer membrane subunit [Sphingobacterium spiritivorum]EFK55788.1 efflux transporter, outer membrane factor lipoprotein, NodT family [Sphingobacterium spiritivorum ATCC 33861]QQT37304.1 efflux transporter outer membrane subunit [Sphingobacterium spiritivorum]WQD34089.1 efflux transporter outer membrane subunit [Sphingobacterium spiritivorum]SUJ29456.1 Outer membrane protein oprM precursor [Sphingobacterium spiritivorum]
MNMMENSKTKSIITAIAFALMLAGCKAPKATIVKDEVKENIPLNFQSDGQQDTVQNSGTTPWRQFFTDPNLVALIETALKNNQELLITLQEIEIAKNGVLYKNGKLSPTVAAKLGAGVSKAGRYTSEGAGDATTEIEPGKEMPDPLGNFEGALVANWEVDIWKKLRTEKQAAIAHYLATVEGKNFVLSNLIEEVADNYYELLALDNQLDIVQQYIKLQERALEISKIQKEAAATTELAVKKFEAELSKSKATAYTIHQEITEKENQINALLGRYPQPVVRTKESFMSTIAQPVYTGIPSQLLANRPDIKEAELELKAAKLDVEAARKEFYPSLEISAALGLEAFKPSYLVKMPESIAFGLAGELAGPLINKSAIKANFQTADARQLQALYEYDKTILNAYLDIANLMSKVKNIDQYYKMKSQETQALDESIEIANQLFKNSRADYLEVLLNQRDALDAKLELIEAKQKQLSTVVDIYKGLGGGWK